MKKMTKIVHKKLFDEYCGLIESHDDNFLNKLPLACMHSQLMSELLLVATEVNNDLAIKALIPYADPNFEDGLALSFCLGNDNTVGVKLLLPHTNLGPRLKDNASLISETQTPPAIVKMFFNALQDEQHEIATKQFLTCCCRTENFAGIMNVLKNPLAYTLDQETIMRVVEFSLNYEKKAMTQLALDHIQQHNIPWTDDVKYTVREINNFSVYSQMIQNFTQEKLYEEAVEMALFGYVKQMDFLLSKIVDKNHVLHLMAETDESIALDFLRERIAVCEHQHLTSSIEGLTQKETRAKRKI